MSTASPEVEGPNAEQIRYWNQQAGPKWVAQQAQLDAQLADLGARTMAGAAIVAGEALLDIGCGCGATTIELGRRTSATGSVLGVDISAPMLEVARRRAADAGQGNVQFELADAQTHPLSAASRDVVFSRFGVMFFADPVAAFANVRRALRPGGRLAFVCWQALPLNPWMAIPLGAVAQHLPLPPPPAPDAPGPFAFADGDRVGRILRDAGYADVELEPVADHLTVGGTASLDEAARFLITLGPAAALLAGADDAVRARVADAVRAAIAPHHGPHGVRMPAAAWIVRARYSR